MPEDKPNETKTRTYRSKEKKNNMSVSEWAYDARKCDGEPCPGDCDSCNLAKEPSLKDDIKLLIKNTGGLI